MIEIKKGQLIVAKFMKTVEIASRDFISEDYRLATQREIRSWNAALYAAAENARTRTNDESTSIVVDTHSILNLKVKP